MIKRSINSFFFVLLLAGIFSCVQSSKEKKNKKSHKMTHVVSDVRTHDFTQQVNVLFIKYCSACHGNDGKKGLNGAKDLTITNKSLDKIIKRVNEGKGNMPGFKGILNNQQITEISKYVKGL